MPLSASQASLRRVAAKELSKFSNSFTSLDSSLLFYALVFFHEGVEREGGGPGDGGGGGSGGGGEWGCHSRADGAPSECDGFLSIKLVGQTSASTLVTPTSSASATAVAATLTATAASAAVASATAAVNSFKKTIADKIPASLALPTSLPHPTSLFSSTSSSSSLSSSASSWSRTYVILEEGNLLKFESETQEWTLLFNRE